MHYLEFVFSTSSSPNAAYQKDVLIHALSEANFDTFEETPEGFNAYIPAPSYSEEKFYEALAPYQTEYHFMWDINEVPEKNWNEVWESNFDPLIIQGKCYVRATFHEPKPYYPIEIIMDPKMAFGTGHHQTTAMMMEYILEENISGKRILDMGSGTGILAILSSKLGAKEITAIDYDPVCYDSIIENSRINNTPFNEVLCGSKEVIPSKEFDIILANINRNILLDQLDVYSNALIDRGELYMSGFYEDDLEVITDKANQCKLSFVNHKSVNNWCAVKFLKQT